MKNIYNTALWRVPVTFLLVILFVVFSVLPMMSTIASAQSPIEGQMICSDVLPVSGPSLVVQSLEGLQGTAGEDFTIAAKIVNNQTYDINDVAVGVGVFKGEDTVPFDWFWANEGVSVKAGSEVEVPLQWNVPKNTDAGQYTLRAFLSIGNNSEILSNVFSVGNQITSIPFSVVGEAAVGSYFDKDSIKINGVAKTYGQVATIPATATDLDVTIDMRNDNAELPARGMYTLKVYSGLYPSEATLLQSEENEARLVSEMVSSKTISVPVSSDTFTIVGEYNAGTEERSVFVVVVKKEGESITPATVSPMVSHLGLKANDDGTRQAVACINHSLSMFEEVDESFPVYPVEYKITAYALGGDASVPLTEATGSVQLSGFVNNAGITLPNVPAEGEVVVRLELMTGGVTTDIHESRYGCQEGSGCGTETVVGEAGNDQGLSSVMVMMIMKVIALIILLLFVLLGVSMILKKKTTQ